MPLFFLVGNYVSDFSIPQSCRKPSFRQWGGKLKFCIIHKKDIIKSKLYEI